MKKGFCVLLTIVLLFTVLCMPLSVSAATEEEKTPREILAEFIFQTETMLTNDAFTMTVPERQALTQKLAHAKEVYANQTATDNDITLASAQLLAAMESPLYRSLLTETKLNLVNMLDLMSFALYDTEIEKFNTILKMCDGLLAEETITAAEYEAFYIDFMDIALSMGNRSATKEQLGTLVKKAEAYMESTRYTTDSYSFFEDAYESAVAVYGDTAATQEDIDLAFATLCAAILSLAERPVPTTYGDVNGDGQITITDVLVIQKRLARIEDFSPAQEQYGDVNGDKIISTADVLLVQKHIAHMIDSFPAENPGDIGDTGIDDVPAA